MVGKTLDDSESGRDDVAQEPRKLVGAIEGESEANSRAGNETITTRRPSSIGYELGVRESSSILRGIAKR